jgi:hypothetical protein
MRSNCIFRESKLPTFKSPAAPSPEGFILITCPLCGHARDDDEIASCPACGHEESPARPHPVAEEKKWPQHTLWSLVVFYALVATWGILAVAANGAWTGMILLACGATAGVWSIIDAGKRGIAMSEGGQMLALFVGWFTVPLYLARTRGAMALVWFIVNVVGIVCVSFISIEITGALIGFT